MCVDIDYRKGWSSVITVEYAFVGEMQKWIFVVLLKSNKQTRLKNVV